jgi:N utilization substance protein A
MPREKLIKEADLEEVTVDEVLEILRYEFEDDADIDAGQDQKFQQELDQEQEN